MFWRTGLLLTSLILATTLVLAQQTMTVSKRHSTLGYPLQEGYEWELGEPPLIITFLYNNGKTTIDHGTVNFYVENTSDKSIPKEKVTVSIGQRRNWVATKYAITAPGDYEVSLSLPGRESDILASNKFTVSGRKPAPKPKPKPEPKPVSEKKDPPKPKPAPKPKPKKEEPKPETEKSISIPDLAKMNSKLVDLPGLKLDLPEIKLAEDEEVAKEFEHMFIQFGRKIESGMLMGQNEKFKLMEGGTPIISTFSHTKPFDTEMIGVSVWLMPKGSKEYSVHYDEIKIPVKPTDQTANFNIQFNHAGHYRFELYNEDLIKLREIIVWIYAH